MRLTHSNKHRKDVPFLWSVTVRKYWGCEHGVVHATLYAEWEDAKKAADDICTRYKRENDDMAGTREFKMVDQTIDGADYKHNRCFCRQITWKDHGDFVHRDVCLNEIGINI